MWHGEEAFEHNNPRGTICTLLWKFILKSIKTPSGNFHYRAQDRVSFTARLTSLILQQYKIGFKVELKYIKSAVVVNVMINTDEGLFSISRKANDINKRNGE